MIHLQLLDILREGVRRGASDIIIIAGLPVSYKVDGIISREEERLRQSDTDTLVSAAYEAAGNRNIKHFLTQGDDDFSFAVPSLARFRVNALRQRGSAGLVIRVVSFSLPKWDALSIPENVMAFSGRSRGLLLVTGPAGSGKSTTLACIVDAMNASRNAHIITIEDPIEYLHQHKNCIVTQRELDSDTVSYSAALRAALREAPDVILLGEMRDPETIKAAVTAAETGQFVISTLHTTSAASTVDRIVDAFPPEQQTQIRAQVALTLEGITSQVLIPSTDGGLVPAFEIMNATPAIRTMIRESKTHQIDNIISQSGESGMITLDQSLLKLVQAGKISSINALTHCSDPEWLQKRISAEA